MPRNYRLKERREASRTNMLVLRTSEISKLGPSCSISVGKTNYTIHWIAIYLVDSIIHPLNNWGQADNTLSFLLFSTKFSSARPFRNEHLDLFLTF